MRFKCEVDLELEICSLNNTWGLIYERFTLHSALQLLMGGLS